MSQVVIKAEGLAKKYQIGQLKATSIRDRVLNLRKAQSKIRDEFWALQDVSFELEQGQAVGIIGRNGAGKSTLLKILSRITYPTNGRFEMTGRVASLLEVGTGFHPELSGRENVFLNGTILGMNRSEIRQKFDEIVEFSGVEKFVDTPVKHYSSGMYVRLAFAVAAHLDPEILIIDEVLAVGDQEFQNKCLGKMDQVTKQGRTVLFVSHNMSAVSSLTTKCLFLEAGKVRQFGATNSVVNAYLNVESKSGWYHSKEKSNKPKIMRMEVHTSEPGYVHAFKEDLGVEFELWMPDSMRGACLSFQILRSDNVPIIHNWIFDEEQPFLREKGMYKVRCLLPECELYLGDYFLKAYFTDASGRETFSVLENVCHFSVEMLNKQRASFPFKHGDCTYLNEFDWEVTRI